MISDYSPIEMKEKEIQYINETSRFVYLRFLLIYISLTNYYIVQDTFK